MHPGKKCPFSTGQGCSDYDRRPADPCRSFNCAWILPGSPLPEWMRPDAAKVIVLWREMTFGGIPIDVAVPVGRRIPPRALEWLKQFAQRHHRMLVYTEQVTEQKKFTGEQSVAAFGPPEMTPYMPQIIENYMAGKR